MIKAALFDFGGVLTESGKKGFIAKILAELLGVPEKDIDITDLHLDLRRGKSDEDTFFREINRRYNGHVTKESFLERTTLPKLSREVIELARLMRTRGIRTGILSNVFALNARALRTAGLYEGFDPVILSCDEGFAKPDKEIYQIAIDRLGVRAEEVLFIDDQEKCTAAAAALGMHVVLAASPDQIVTDTKSLLVSLNGVRL